MEKLVKKAKKGDAEAFIALMEQNRQSMIRIAFAYLGNEEDVADAMQGILCSHTLDKHIVFSVAEKNFFP
jgi:DNA-directed RNA polymerase specialized sigma24 family protein